METASKVGDGMATYGCLKDFEVDFLHSSHSDLVVELKKCI